MDPWYELKNCIHTWRETHLIKRHIVLIEKIWGRTEFKNTKKIGAQHRNYPQNKIDQNHKSLSAKSRKKEPWSEAIIVRTVSVRLNGEKDLAEIEIHALTLGLRRHLWWGGEFRSPQMSYPPRTYRKEEEKWREVGEKRRRQLCTRYICENNPQKTNKI